MPAFPTPKTSTPNAAEPAPLSDAISAPISDQDRYSRQILFAPIGPTGQQLLAHAHVVIVGVGATGAATASLLARAGVGRLTLIDRDFVEPSNLQRQMLFDEADARASLPKAEAARLHLTRINSSIHVTAHIADLVPANAPTLLAADLVLDCTDNFETRYLINDLCVRDHRPWIYAAAVGAYAATMNILPQPAVSTDEPLSSTEDDRHPEQSAHPTDGRHPEQSAHPTDGRRPGRRTQPADDRHPEQSAHPTDDRHPEQSAHPTEDRHPERSAQPADGHHPEQSAHPTEDRHPEQSAHPTEDRHPERRAQPAAEGPLYLRTERSDVPATPTAAFNPGAPHTPPSLPTTHYPLPPAPPTACLACIFPSAPTGNVDTCETAGILSTAVNLAASIQVTEALKYLTRQPEAMRRTLLSFDLWSNQRSEISTTKPREDCEVCNDRIFRHLAGDQRPHITLCGRNSVQIHQHHHPINLAELETRLKPLGPTRANGLLLRFTYAPYTLTVFPDGRALIQGTTDPALARSLYARFIGS